jgi:hypothetical protein
MVVQLKRPERVALPTVGLGVDLAKLGGREPLEELRIVFGPLFKLLNHRQLAAALPEITGSLQRQLSSTIPGLPRIIFVREPRQPQAVRERPDNGIQLALELRRKQRLI